jgi:hypothetical protein
MREQGYSATTVKADDAVITTAVALYCSVVCHETTCLTCCCGTCCLQRLAGAALEAAQGRLQEDASCTRKLRGA